MDRAKWIYNLPFVIYEVNIVQSKKGKYHMFGGYFLLHCWMIRSFLPGRINRQLAS